MVKIISVWQLKKRVKLAVKPVINIFTIFIFYYVNLIDVFDTILDDISNYNLKTILLLKGWFSEIWLDFCREVVVESSRRK